MTPLNDRVILRQFVEAATSDGGIVLPEQSRKKLPEAEVIAVGPKVEQVQVGDRVIFNTYSTNVLPSEEGDLVIVDEADILVILDKGITIVKETKYGN